MIDIPDGRRPIRDSSQIETMPLRNPDIRSAQANGAAGASDERAVVGLWVASS
jgi:hypothetical protein